MQQNSKSMSDSLKNQATKFSFGEYAETVGPQGLQFVLNGILFFGLFWFYIRTHQTGETPRWRKLMWMSIVCVGIVYSSYNIKLCAVRYYSYPSTIKPAKDANGLVRFPKVLACLNVST